MIVKTKTLCHGVSMIPSPTPLLSLQLFQPIRKSHSLKKDKANSDNQVHTCLVHILLIPEWKIKMQDSELREINNDVTKCKGSPISVPIHTVATTEASPTSTNYSNFK